MKKIEVSTLNAPSAIGPYSQAIEVGNTLYISGQIPVDVKTGVMPETIEEQAQTVFNNISGILDEAGYDISNVVKVTVYLTDLKTFNAVNTVYADFFVKPYPARSCIEVSALPRDAMVEVECIAVK